MKTKHLILTLAFLALTLISDAQENKKYEYLTLRQYYEFKTTISVSIDGREHSVEKPQFEGDQGKGSNPLFIFVHKYEALNWELVGVTFGAGTDCTAFMKRKVTEQK